VELLSQLRQPIRSSESGNVSEKSEAGRKTFSSMAPVAIYPPSDDPSKSTVPAKGPALVIGSLSTAEDGKYQHLVSELEATRQVERQLLDRLLDRGNVSGFPTEESYSWP